MKRTILVVSLVLAAMAPQLFADGGVPVWTNRYHGPGNNANTPSGIATDGNGNVFVTGASDGGISSGTDYATLAYTGAGALLWINRFNGLGNYFDQATGIAVDTNGNVFVTGFSSRTNFVSSNWDYATLAYSGDGAPLWTNLYDGPPDWTDAPRAIAVDGAGNVLVTGASAASNGYYDYVTIKYSGAGVGLWTNRYDGPGNSTDIPVGIKVDRNGNVFVTGTSGGNYATIAYSSAGETLWTNLYGEAGTGATAAGVAVSPDGTVFVAGSVTNNSSGYDYITIAYSNSGAPLWTNRYNGSANKNDGAKAVAVDGSGNVFVTGYSTNSSSGYDYATVAYSSVGVPLWTNLYNGPDNGNDLAQALAVDSSGNVIVTGYSTNNSSGYDFATVAYSGTGVPLWSNRYDGPGHGKDMSTSITVDRFGNVYITGESSGDYVTIKYSSSVPAQPIPLEIQALVNQLVLTWTNASFRLQSAPAITGTFTNLPGATSPYTNPISGAQQFFRLISN